MIPNFDLAYLFRIACLQENGIYDYEERTALKYKGFGPTLDETVDYPSQEAQSLSVSKLKGILFVTSVLLIVSIILLIFELFIVSI